MFLVLVGCASGSPTGSSSQLTTEQGCFDEDAGFAPDVPECHRYLGAWSACDAPDPAKDAFETCASPTTLIETDGGGRHEHDGAEADAREVDCDAWCDEQLGWDGCDYVGACVTEAIACRGGTVDAGLCTCTQGGAKTGQLLGCATICCDVDGTLSWITPEYCEMYGGTNLGDDVEDCF